ncbi:MAG: metal-dependent transcriptional regulator [Lachnospiraceae bacterium]|nr:metal-dependent transcriptional regulator [Lachnospiraceae bacterium]
MQKNNITEDYLECILILNKTESSVRSIDIARRIGVTKPTVSSMIKKLLENNYINIDDDKYITLTDKGLEKAKKVYEKHLMLGGFLRKIGVSKEKALEEAGLIEHIIGEETYECLERLYESTLFNTYASKVINLKS